MLVKYIYENQVEAITKSHGSSTTNEVIRYLKEGSKKR